MEFIDTTDGLVVSKDGRVFREIKPYYRGKNGAYKCVSYNGGREDVHRLVAKLWVPNPKDLPIVCHKDDNPSNNHADNLYWGSPFDNLRDVALKNNIPKAYLSKYKTVWQLKQLGWKQRDIATQLDLGESRISQILKIMREFREVH